MDGLDRDNARQATRDCLVLYEDMTSHKPCLLEQSHSLFDRSVLCCVKRVYGAAFSEYPPSTSDTGNLVLESFVLEARECRFKPSKTVESRRRQLHRSAEKVTKLMKEMLGDEVRKYLNRIASLLMDSDAKLTWHVLGNNCQRLIDRLLKGKDFEYAFPRIPKGFGSVDSMDLWKMVQWPRYLISFGDRIEGKDISIQQPNSAVTKFCHNNISDGDIVDFLELEISRVGLNSGNSRFKDLSELALVIPQPKSENYSQLSNNALWDLPRDSLSILQYHLLRPSSKYSTITGQVIDETQWTQSRFRLLHQLDTIASYTGALGSALLDLFHREPKVMSKITIPKSRIFGSLRADEMVSIIRSGSMVVYVIARRKEGLAKALDQAATMFKAIQKSSEKYPGKTGTRVLNSGAVEALLMRLLKASADPKERRAIIRESPLKDTLLQNLWPALVDMFSFNTELGSTTIQTLPLQVIKIANRDNWLYLSFGDVIFAYQTWRKSKNTRKGLRQGSSRKPLAQKR